MRLFFDLIHERLLFHYYTKACKHFSLPFGLSLLTPCLPCPRHPSRKMIPRAVFAFLLLQDRIIHMDIVEHSRQILMPQQLLQRKGIIALDKIVHGKGMPENVRTDALS